MENTADDDDLKLVKASAGLLSDLESALPRILWRPSDAANQRSRVHTRVKQQDIDYVVRLIEPFQGEPQLLDTKLRLILPPISEAYTEYLKAPIQKSRTKDVDLQPAICVILYTLCKVRGYKIVLGFLNNEPRYLEPILLKLEEILAAERDNSTEWQVPYVLLLWLAHLTLTPFDLLSISDRRNAAAHLNGTLPIRDSLPAIAERLLSVGLKYLSSSTKAQDAAAILLVRLVGRPDMQKLGLADALVPRLLDSLESQASESTVTVYERIGPLRFLAGVVDSSELRHLIPNIYKTCAKLSDQEESFTTTNAVAKKLVVKVFRNITIQSLRSTSVDDPLVDFLESTNVVEEVIDYLLRSLGDRDTPVRYASAKALSLIILQLEPSMGHEVIQAILDSFKEDVPQNGEILDFRQVDPLRWHGLTLALAHALFKRSASPDQLPDIVNALVSALQFEQRTATGSSIGTNVRDAANFGMWSLSRRYTTKELLSVETTDLRGAGFSDTAISVIQWLAVQLLLSACLDPAGNIRRGSSAALQELIGRHPDQVYEGITLVQVVDYQAVGLRKRAIEDVVNQAAQLQKLYWSALAAAIFGWRGLGSADVPSREAAAASLTRLSRLLLAHDDLVLRQAMQKLHACSGTNFEDLHGLVLLLAFLFQHTSDGLRVEHSVNGQQKASRNFDVGNLLQILMDSTSDFSLRLLRSELPSATAQLLTALCRILSNNCTSEYGSAVSRMDIIDTLTERILSRHEETIQQTIPLLVKSLLVLKRHMQAPLDLLGTQQLCKRVALDGSKSTLHGAGRAIALGTLAPIYDGGLARDKAVTALTTLGDLTNAMNVDWRVISLKAIQLALDSSESDKVCGVDHIEIIINAVHRGANDYTIDERGDIGSLVRLQAIACTGSILSNATLVSSAKSLEVSKGDILRLSLEKLDRVRIAAAQCQRGHMGFGMSTGDVASVSSLEYFTAKLGPLGASDVDISTGQPSYEQTALLEGCISCAGISAEPLLQASRSALVHQLIAADVKHLQHLMTLFSGILKSMVVDGKNMHPALELLAFLFDMQLPQRIAETEFKWRDLLSTVQKAHYKSNDIPKILAAVHVYRGMAEIAGIRHEVMKKLISMLKTNPYPKVRSSVAEHLYVVTGVAALRDKDWTKPASQHGVIIRHLEEQYVRS